MPNTDADGDGLLAGGEQLAQQQQQQHSLLPNYTAEFGFHEPMDNLLTDPDQIDWNLVDQYIFNRSAVADLDPQQTLSVPAQQSSQLLTPGDSTTDSFGQGANNAG